MRFHRSLALLPLVHGALLSFPVPEQSDIARIGVDLPHVEHFHADQVNHDAGDGVVGFHLPSRSDQADASFDIAFQVLKTPGHDDCGNSSLVLNGVSFQNHFSDDDRQNGSSSDQAIGLVPLVDREQLDDYHPLTLSLVSVSECLYDSHYAEQHTASTSTSTSAPAEPVLRTTFSLVAVDSKPVSHDAAFTVYFNHHSGKILDVQSSLPHSILAQESGSSGSQTDELVDHVPEIEHEIERLKLLETQLDELRAVLRHQQHRVQQLSTEQWVSTKDDLASCESIGCLFSTLYQKAKKNLHIVFVSLRPATTEKSSCSGPVLSPSMIPQASMSLGISGLDDQRKPLLSTDTSSQGEAADSKETQDAAETGWERLNTAQVFLAVAASVLCLSCCGYAVQRSRCTPRARADRAARREERRTARQYRILARRRDWKKWWANSRFLVFRRADPRIHDYEEKRAMILQQEAVLEDIAQQEIRHLRNPDAIYDAEQGRTHAVLPRTTTIMARQESLPGYRSRANSTRPPSYHSVDVNAIVEVVDGFSNYTPTDLVNEGNEVTPDSSVIQISPRQSSETLRTEFNTF